MLKTTATSGKGVHRILPGAGDRGAPSTTSACPTGAAQPRGARPPGRTSPSPTGKIRYAVQGAIDPPTFTLFVAGRLAPTYLRYVERSLRERFDLGSTPLRVRVRIE